MDEEPANKEAKSTTKPLTNGFIPKRKGKKSSSASYQEASQLLEPLRSTILMRSFSLR